MDSKPFQSVHTEYEVVARTPIINSEERFEQLIKYFEKSPKPYFEVLDGFLPDYELTLKALVTEPVFDRICLKYGSKYNPVFGGSNYIEIRDVIIEIKENWKFPEELEEVPEGKFTMITLSWKTKDHIKLYE